MYRVLALDPPDILSALVELTVWRGNIHEINCNKLQVGSELLKGTYRAFQEPYGLGRANPVGGGGYGS